MGMKDAPENEREEFESTLTHGMVEGSIDVNIMVNVPSGVYLFRVGSMSAVAIL
jgi:hypothetical protein